MPSEFGRFLRRATRPGSCTNRGSGMTPADAVFVDPLGRQAAAVSAKLARWMKDRKVAVNSSVYVHNALQHLRVSGPQVVPNIHHALSRPAEPHAGVLALTALDTCFNSMHLLLGALPTDTKAFSIVDDLMSLRDEVEARFPSARAQMNAEDPTDTLAGTGPHRFNF